MLTPKALTRATRQMLKYGELKSSALGHLSDKVTGYAAGKRARVTNGNSSSSTAGKPRAYYKWSEEAGDFVLFEEQ